MNILPTSTASKRLRHSSNFTAIVMQVGVQTLSYQLGSYGEEGNAKDFGLA